MEDRKYFTTHKGIAAYMLMQGHFILQCTPGISKKTNKPNVKIEFDVDAATGRELGDAFFNGEIEGNLKEFYDSLQKVGNEIWKAKQANQ